MQKTAGILLFLAGAIVILGIETAEMFYPGYSVSKYFISTLGASPPPHSIIVEPSAFIFDTSMKAAGLLIALAAYLFYKLKYKKHITAPVFLMGIGAFGVGTFPAFHPVVHPIFAALAFFSGGFGAILSSTVIKGPFRPLSFILGSITLVFLLIGVFAPHTIVPLLGNGGTERWVAYPALIWLLGYGGYLMGGNYSK